MANNENKGKEAAKKGMEAAEKQAIQAAGAALGPEAALPAKVASEVPLFRKIIEGGLFSCGLGLLASAVLIIMVVLAIIAALPKGFFGRPSLSGDPSAGGCYVTDGAFTAVKTTSADEVLKKLSKYNNLQGKKVQVQKIIDKSRAAGINYYLLLDIWAGEQTFGNDEKAFGCGVYGGQNRSPGFDSQLDCAIDKIKKAINNQEPYNKPAGVNIFTRLFYTYTGGMQQYYQRYGYVAGPDNARIIVHKLLAFEEVICAEGNLGPGLANIGEKLYPPLGNLMTQGTTGPYRNGPHYTFCCGSCNACAVDYSRPAGTPVYAITDGMVNEFYKYTNKKLNEYRGWNIKFTSTNGQIYAIYAHVVPAGRLSGLSGGQVGGIKKGEQIATIFNYPGGDHLHFELKINGQSVGIQGGHNYQLDYFGSVK